KDGHEESNPIAPTSPLVSSSPSAYDHQVGLAVPPHMGQVLPLMHGLSLRPSGAFPGESLCRLPIQGTPDRSKLFGSTARGRGFISSDQVGAGSSPGPIEPRHWFKAPIVPGCTTTGQSHTFHIHGLTRLREGEPKLNPAETEPRLAGISTGPADPSGVGGERGCDLRASELARCDPDRERCR